MRVIPRPLCHRSRPEPARAPQAGKGPARAPALLAALVLLSLAPHAARATKVVAIKTSDIPAYNLALDGFKSAYKGELDVQDLGASEELTDALASKIRASRPDVVVAIGSKAATSAAARLSGLPIVYCMVLSPEKRGLVGANFTGVSLEIPAREQLRQFKRVVPKLERVGAIFNPKKTGPLVLEARAAARQLGLKLIEYAVEEPGQVPDALKVLAGRVDGLWLLPDASVVTRETFKHILLVTLERRIPLMVFSVPFVQAGALVGVAPDYAGIGKAVAALVAEVAGGTSPTDLPLRAPPSRIVVNERTAERIGLHLGPDLRKDTTIVK